MYKRLILLIALMLYAVGVKAQETASEFHPNDTSIKWQCDPNLQWPPNISACPEVLIRQKWDHTPQQKYMDRGWDTAVTCSKRDILLSCTPYIPVQFFNGRYTVDEIPYDPPDPTFHYQTNIPAEDDDIFAGVVNLPMSSANGAHPFPFFFFGERKTAFVAGANGIITFNTAAANQGCAYGVYDPLPWKNDSASSSNTSFGTNMAANNVGRHRNAIYGVLQDTDPGCGTSGTGATNPAAPYYQGAWYGIMDEFPCRKIIASYNNIPWFSCSSNENNRQRYQIVCYEGSNIIEVHIARRTSGSCTGWCHNGIIGIQNSNGLRQHPGAQGSSTQFIINNAYAAYYPAITNQGKIGDETFIEKAYRFTPQGRTYYDYGWYRIVSDGVNDTLDRVDNNDNDFQTAMDKDDQQFDDFYNPAPCPTLTTAYLRNITEPTRVVFFLKFQNADQVWYNLADTIFIGVDNDNTMDLHGAPDAARDHVYDICASDIANSPLYLDYPALNDTVNTAWEVHRVSGRDTIPLNRDDVVTIDNIQVIDSLDIKRIPVHLKQDMPTQGRRENKVDSIYFQVSADFNNGCDSNTVCLLRIFPEFDTIDTVNTCLGKTYFWKLMNRTFHDHESGIYTVDTTSKPGCDSIVHLDLRFNDVRTIPVVVEDCQPYTWDGTGYTYYKTNTATRDTDTIHVMNEFGCEDILQLHLTLYPLKAIIHSSLDHFDYDHMEVELVDISENAGTRRWLMPDGSEETGLRVYYTIPRDSSEALFGLVTYSEHGECIESTWVTLPFNKETLYMPNAFMPDDRTTDNNLFGSHSTNITSQEMYIYNRRGELVYQCESVDCTWDGRDLHGKPCEQGVYVYLIRYTNTFEPDRIQVKRGTVTLIR